MGTVITNLNNIVNDSINSSYSDSVIKQKYEANVDTNAFTDEEKSVVAQSTEHMSGDGSDHTFIDQDVTTTGSPAFSSVQLNGGAGAEGTVAWNDDDKTLDLVCDSSVTLQVGQELLTRGKNTSGDTITSGKVVMVTGAVGASGVMELGLHDGTKTNGYKVVGITTEDIANNDVGFSLLRGKLRGVNTTGSAAGETWNDGDILFVSPLGNGELTNVAPALNELRMPIAAVISAGVNGTLEVRTTGIDENTTADQVYYDNTNSGMTAETGQDAIDELSAEVSTKFDKSGGTISGDVTIDGDIIQNGAAYETHAEQVYTTKDEIILRNGAVSALAEGVQTGFRAKLYDGTNDGLLVFGNDGVARVGDEGSTQALATREDAPLDDGVAVWNSASSKFETTKDISVDSIVVSGTIDGRDVSIDGAKLDGIEPGAEVNNISDANATGLTNGLDSSLHYHSSDRNRANHTGTQAASTISDFNTEVSNNTDVSANTANRHAHSNKTILDNTTASYTTEEETKLSGIESEATADQTGAEIKALYEAESDTNAFTDTDKAHITSTNNPHNVTRSQIGLGNVDNTADSVKNVASAAKWTTARTLSLTGNATGSANIDGSGDVSMVVTVVDSDKLDGKHAAEFQNLDTIEW